MGVSTTANRAAERGEHLTANEYELAPSGVTCRIFRHVTRAAPLGDIAEASVVTVAWTVNIDRALAFGVSWDGADRHPAQHGLVTQASFPFDPDDPSDEEEQLERARRYCVDVAHVVAGLRPSLEGLVARVAAEISEAVREHGAVPTKL